MRLREQAHAIVSVETEARPTIEAALEVIHSCRPAFGLGAGTAELDRIFAVLLTLHRCILLLNCHGRDKRSVQQPQQHTKLIRRLLFDYFRWEVLGSCDDMGRADYRPNAREIRCDPDQAKSCAPAGRGRTHLDSVVAEAFFSDEAADMVVIALCRAFRFDAGGAEVDQTSPFVLTVHDCFSFC